MNYQKPNKTIHVVKTCYYKYYYVVVICSQVISFQNTLHPKFHWILFFAYVCYIPGIFELSWFSNDTRLNSSLVILDTPL
jgi:hypothetical protein